MENEPHRRSSPIFSGIHAEFLLRVHSIVKETSSSEEAFGRCIEEVCRYTGWPVGHAYIFDETNPREWKRNGPWHFDDAQAYRGFKDVTEERSIVSGADLPGLVLERRTSVWARQLSESGQSFTRFAAAFSCGLNAGAAFPVWCKGDIVGVLEFYAEAPTGNELAIEALMTAVATQLGDAIGRKGTSV